MCIRICIRISSRDVGVSPPALCMKFGLCTAPPPAIWVGPQGPAVGHRGSLQKAMRELHQAFSC